MKNLIILVFVQMNNFLELQNIKNKESFQHYGTILLASPNITIFIQFKRNGHKQQHTRRVDTGT